MAALPAGSSAPAIVLLAPAPAPSVVLVRLGAGGGATGSLTVPLPTGSVPRALAVADLDRDGRQEIVVASDGTDAISVFRLAPDLSSLVEAGSYAAGPDPRALVVADLTGDGRPDVAVATDAGIALLAGDGAGGLGPAQLAVPLASLAGTDYTGAPAPPRSFLPQRGN